MERKLHSFREECNGERNRSTEMYGEKERLCTCHSRQQGALVEPELARARCFCCGVTLKQWVHGDSPNAEHLNLASVRDDGNLMSAPGQTDSVDGQLLSQLQRMAVDEQVSTEQAAYPEMGSESARLNSFSNWPTNTNPPPYTLAQAGFFYTGHDDSVKCFFCDGGLRNWEPGDDPWQEHARWFPRCEYLLQSRGPEYVSNIQSYFNIPEMSEFQTITTGSISTSHEPVVRQDNGVNEMKTVATAEEKVPENLNPEEQLRQLQEERTCKVCMDKVVSMLFIPCGHLVVCSECAASLHHCPICRAVICSSVHAFMS